MVAKPPRQPLKILASWYWCRCIILTTHNEQGRLLLPIGHHKTDGIGLPRLGNKKASSILLSLRLLACFGAIQLPCCGDQQAVRGNTFSKGHRSFLATAGSNSPTLSHETVWSESPAPVKPSHVGSPIGALRPHKISWGRTIQIPENWRQKSQKRR